MKFSDLSQTCVQNPLIIENGLVGYWSFNEQSGSIARDYSAFPSVANTGFLNNSPTWTPGIIGSCLNFNSASNQYVQINNAPVNAFPMTQMAWAKLTNTSISVNQAEVIVGSIQLSSLDAVYIRYFSSPVVGGTAIMTTSQDSTTANNYYVYYPLTLDTNWHHIATVWTGAANASIYFDGVLVPVSSSTTGTPPTHTLMDHTFISTIYYNNIVPFGPFNGNIDEVRIYNRALSAVEIQTIYSST